MKSIFKIVIIVFIGTFLISSKEYIKTNQNRIINKSMIGFYEYKTDVENENHYIVIDYLNGKLIGKYFGSENEGEHGVAFFENEMENLNFKKGKISFEISNRELYSESQFTIVKNNSQKKKSIGFSKTRLKYSGKINGEILELNCESNFGDCWEKKMKFIKLNKKKSANSLPRLGI